MENSKASNTPAYPRAVNHLGVGVADIERAIRWYQEVLGFTLLMGPIEVRATDPGANMHDVLGQDCNALLQAHMVSINGIGIELFQLLDPPHERRDPPLEYWKSGFFHICVTDLDIEGLAGRIASSGGRQRFDAGFEEGIVNIGEDTGPYIRSAGRWGERLPQVSASDLAAPSILKYSVGSRPPDEANSTGPPLGMVMPARLVVRRVWLRCRAVRRLMFL